MYDESETPTTIYAARVVRCGGEAWRRLRFPLEVHAAEAHLSVSERTARGAGVGFPDAVHPATLRLGRLRTPLGVVVEMTRWSDHAVEIGIRPPRHLPFWVSGDRYVRAAYAVLDELARTLDTPAGAALAELEHLPESA